MFFSEDGRSPDEATTILAFVAEYYRGVGVEEYVEVDAAAVGSMVRDMHLDFPHPGGSSQASPFKQARSRKQLNLFVTLQPLSLSKPRCR